MRRLAVACVIGLATVFVITIPDAHAVMVVNIGEQITNGAFTTNLTGWSTSSASVNRRTSADAINTTGGNAGFNLFFGASTSGNGFAVLGDDSGDISGTPGTGTHTLSQLFTLLTVVNGKTVISYDLMISFTTAFDGDDSNSSNKDLFSSTLDSTSLFSQDSGPLPDCGPLSTCLPDMQIVQNPFMMTLTGRSAGSHTLTFSLFENSQPGTGNLTNTASGIDGVSIIAKANLPDDPPPPPPVIPEPASFILLGSGLLAGSGVGRLRRRRT